MKIFNRNNIIVILCLLLAILPVSCLKDDYAAKENTTMMVTFTTRAITGNSNDDAGELEDNEQMHTLRVIMVRSRDKKILHNEYYEFDKFVASKTIIFCDRAADVMGEKLDFYAIANEEGVGFNDNYWDEVNVENFKTMKLGDEFLENANEKSTNTNTKIPQTAYESIYVDQQDGVISRTIQLQFVVAKVRLTINNPLGKEQEVKDISLSNVNYNEPTSLFASDDLSSSSVSMPLIDVITIPKATTTNGVITNGTSTIYAYFYENELLGTDHYILNASYNSNKQVFDISTAANIYQIKRGTMLDINVMLRNVEPEVNVSVVPWTEKSMGVEFN